MALAGADALRRAVRESAALGVSTNLKIVELLLGSTVILVGEDSRNTFDPAIEEELQGEPSRFEILGALTAIIFPFAQPEDCWVRVRIPGEGGDKMKIQVFQGIGGLLVILPSISAGVTYADTNQWPPLSDFRWILVLVGLVLLIGGRILYERELRGGD